VLTFVLAGLRYRRARLLLSSVAVALGVAFIAGTLLLNASMSSSYYARFAIGAKNVAALIAAPESGDPPGQFGGQTVPRSLLGTVGAVPGVGAADGRVIGPAEVIDPLTGRVTGNGFGVNVTAADPGLSGFTLVSGHLPGSPGQVDIDKSTAADEHFRLGEPVKVATSTGQIRVFTLAGTINVGVNPDIGNGTVLAFQTGTAFSVTGQSSYTMIVASARPGVSQSTLAARLSAAAHGYTVQTGARFASEEVNATTEVGNVFSTGILIFAAIALIVACIVIYNTFSILIAQRSREFALLRCVGASRRQVFRGMTSGGGRPAARHRHQLGARPPAGAIGSRPAPAGHRSVRRRCRGHHRRDGDGRRLGAARRDGYPDTAGGRGERVRSAGGGHQAGRLAAHRLRGRDRRHRAGAHRGGHAHQDPGGAARGRRRRLRVLPRRTRPRPADHPAVGRVAGQPLACGDSPDGRR
jgi:hypothetical protein